MTRTSISLLLSTIVLAAFLPAATAVALDSASQAVDVTPQFKTAALPIADLQVFEIGGIVVIRGHATSRTIAEQAGVVAGNLGFTRVANLVKIVSPPDDAAIRRAAERELTYRRSLDGCKLSVESHDGVVHVAGTVASDAQKDEVIAVLRNVDGVRDVRVDLQR